MSTKKEPRMESVYRCRFCGQTFGHVDYPASTMETLLWWSIHPPKAGEAESLNLLEKHNCKGGAMGVADLIGVRKS